jgi:hypothetical protein
MASPWQQALFPNSGFRRFEQMFPGQRLSKQRLEAMTLPRLAAWQRQTVSRDGRKTRSTKGAVASDDWPLPLAFWRGKAWGVRDPKGAFRRDNLPVRLGAAQYVEDEVTSANGAAAAIEQRYLRSCQLSRQQDLYSLAALARLVASKGVPNEPAFCRGPGWLNVNYRF